MSEIFKAACVQLCAGRSMQANIDEAESYVREAAGNGAHYVLTPEQTALMELERATLFDQIKTEDADPALPRFRALAQELGIWLHIGSLAIKLSDDKAANRSFLISPDGEITARYDKIHMFDVNLPGGERYRESATYQPGTRATLANLPWGMVGMSICYDLRFAALYRAYAQAGASFLTTPAAFTKQTGEAHWHILQRARAVETGCFVLAAAQGGDHENGRQTFGHSIIVAPWGEILAEAETAPGVIMAEIDTRLVAEARHKVPALTHDRAITIDHAGNRSERSAS